MKIAITSTGPTLDDHVEARFGRCAYFLIIDTDTMQCEPIENPNMALGGGAGIQSAQLMSEKGVVAVLTGNCGPNAFNVFGQAGVQVISGISGSVRSAVEQFKTGDFSSASAPNVASHFGMSAAPAGPGPTGQPMPNPVGQGGGMGLGMGGGRGQGRGMGMGGGRGQGRGMGGGRGKGQGMGMGGGRGQGRGMGMGGGRGMGQAMDMPTVVPPTSTPAIFPQGPESQSPEQELAALKQQAELLEQQRRQLNNRMAQLESGRKAIAVVDSDKCTGCGICEDVCPVRAVTVEGYAIVNPDICNGCALCVAQCPQNAIVLTQQEAGK